MVTIYSVKFCLKDKKDSVCYFTKEKDADSFIKENEKNRETSGFIFYGTYATDVFENIEEAFDEFKVDS